MLYILLFFIIFFIFLIISVRFINGSKFLIRIWAFFIGFPFFINIGGPGGVSLGRSIFESNPVGQTIPLSFFFMLLIICLGITRYILIEKEYKIKISLITKLFLMMASIGTILLLCGLFYGLELANIIFFLQFLAPFLAYLTIKNYTRSESDFNKYLKLMVRGSVLGIVLLFISNIFEFGPGIITSSVSFNDKMFFLNIYQIYDYYPVTVAITSILLLSFLIVAKNIRYKFFYLFELIISVLTLTHLNARNALLLFVIGSLLFILFSRMNILRKISISGFGMFIMLFLFSTELPVFNRIENADTSVRVLRMKEGVEYFLNHILFGSLFRESEVTGFHNQYLEIATRGGIIIILLFLLIITIHILRSIAFNKYVSNNNALYFTVITCVIIAVMLGSNIAQSNFTQPYTAIMLWFLIGLQDGIINKDLIK